MAQPSEPVARTKKALPPTPQRKSNSVAPPASVPVDKTQTVALPAMMQAAAAASPVERKVSVEKSPIGSVGEVPTPVARKVSSGALQAPSSAKAQETDAINRLETLTKMRNRLLGNIFNENTSLLFADSLKGIEALKKHIGANNPYIAGRLMILAKRYKDSIGSAAACYEQAFQIYYVKGEKEKAYQIAVILSSQRYWDAKWEASWAPFVGIRVGRSAKVASAIYFAEEAIELSKELYGDVHKNTSKAYTQIAEIHRLLLSSNPSAMRLRNEYEELAILADPEKNKS